MSIDDHYEFKMKELSDCEKGTCNCERNEELNPPIKEELKLECEHSWELNEQRPSHWYSWYSEHLFFYCKKCLSTTNFIRRDK